MSLLRNTMTVGSLTLLSRILGFIRDVLIAQNLGTGLVADAFLVAFRFPNLFRRFFAEGAFNSAFVPLYAKKLEGEGLEAARAFASQAMSGLTLMLVVFSVIAMIAMPWFIMLTAPGFMLGAGDHAPLAFLKAFELFLDGEATQKFDLAVDLTRICFPYLLFMSLVALLSGVLNSMHRYVAASAAPIILNLMLVFYPMLTWHLYPTPGHALVWSVTIAGVLQLGLMVWGCTRLKALPRLVRPRWTPEMRRLVTLGIPGIIAGGITQINIVIGTAIASGISGAVAMLSYADRIYQLPLGLIGVAMGVVLLPDLARRLRAGDHGGAQWTQNRALEMSMLLTVPAAAALIAIPSEIVRALFVRGQFTEADAAGTAACLLWFGIGLPAFVLIKVFQAQFFAREDMGTPMRLAALNTAINIAGSLTFVGVFGFVAIAAATSIAAWVNALLLIWRLRQTGGITLDERVVRRLPRTVLASALMGVLLFGAAQLLADFFAQAWLIKFAVLLGLTGFGLLAYFGLVVMVGAASLKDLGGALRRPRRAD
jgi:putative peptidoglycan lipid II flippase